jgi:hypothetical protein
MAKTTKKTKSIQSFETKETVTLTNKEQNATEGGKRGGMICVDWRTGNFTFH